MIDGKEFVPGLSVALNGLSFAKDECDWITVSGQHICIKEGQSKQEAIKEHFAKWKRTGDLLDKIYQAKNSWNTPGVYRAIRKESEAIVKSGKILQPTSKAQLLLNEIRNAKKSSTTVYRGMMVKPSDPVLKLKSGKVLQVPAISSFSNSRSDARDFALGLTAKGASAKGTSVIVQVKGGIRGVRIDNDLHELITNGKFKVIGTPYYDEYKDFDSKVYKTFNVTLKQVGVL